MARLVISLCVRGDCVRGDCVCGDCVCMVTVRGGCVW